MSYDGVQIQKPADVDATRIKSSLTSDGILTVGASLQSPKHCRYHSPSLRCRTPLLSPSKCLPAPPELKPGVPVFRDDIARQQRRLHLSVDVGTMFKPNDITVQVTARRSSCDCVQCSPRRTTARSAVKQTMSTVLDQLKDIAVVANNDSPTSRPISDGLGPDA